MSETTATTLTAVQSNTYCSELLSVTRAKRLCDRGKCVKGCVYELDLLDEGRAVI